MGTTLSTLSPTPGSTRKRKRVGRGPGSHRGKTSTRGHNGQKSRSGHHGTPAGFEGGQMPLQRRLPKIVFNNRFRREAYPINIGILSSRFDGDSIDVEKMKEIGLVPKKITLVKILGEGEISKKMIVVAHRFSKSAIAKIEAAGGSAEILTSAKQTAEKQ